jgi:hypothetical protein
MEAPAPPLPHPPKPRGRLGTLACHPLFQFLLLVVCAYQIKEFYPFTHIPMYSDPEARAPYMFLTDVEGKAIGVRAHCGVTNPKMRKMYHGRMKQYCKEFGFDAETVSPEIEQKIAREVLAFLREQALKRNRPLPDTVRLMNASVLPAEDGFTEKFSLLAEG